MNRLEELKQRYANEASKLPSKQLCLLELEIKTELISNLKLKQPGILVWFKDNLGVSSGLLEYRVSLTDAIGATGWADPVFERIDNGMSYTEATGLVRRASKRAKYEGNLTLAQSLKLEMDELKAKRLTISGTSTKKSTSPKVVAAEKGSAAKKLLANIESLVQEYLDETSESVDPYLIAKCKADFIDTIKIAYADLRSALIYARSDSKDTVLEKVGKKRFEQACQVLGMTKAKFGKPISLTEIKRRKNRRAIELHPDRNQNLPESQQKKLEHEFSVVIDAYKVLEMYAQTFGV
jgi:hypothetical protein